jgi:RNA polymerase sigma-70 factor (ECF subfamily)
VYLALEDVNFLVGRADSASSRLAALESYLERLPAEDRRLIRQRYQGRAEADELTRESGASRRALFRKLDRIRRALFECISRRATGDVGA